MIQDHTDFMRNSSRCNGTQTVRDGHEERFCDRRKASSFRWRSVNELASLFGTESTSEHESTRQKRREESEQRKVKTSVHKTQRRREITTA